MAARTTSPSVSARLALLATTATAVLIGLLHVLKPELDPGWRFLSEYAIGPNGWIMTMAFLLWALGCVALFAALRTEVGSRMGRAGLAVLLVVAGALVLAGLFPQDPITGRPEDATTQGSIHAGASMVGIPGIPVAALLISYSLGRNPAWARRKQLLLVLAHLTWITLALMTAYLAWAVPRAGGFGPDVSAGWMNRLVVATYLGWQAAASYGSLRLAQRA